MGLTILQTPLYKTYAVGQEIIFGVIEDTNILVSRTNIKYLAYIYAHNNSQALPSGLIGTFKATPNNAGVGLFDFSAVLQNYVAPDYTGCDTTLAMGFTSQSTFKSVGYDDKANYHPIHLIDKYCLSTESIKYFSVIFGIEYTGGDGVDNVVAVNPNMNTFYNLDLFFNGVLYNEDVLNYGTTIGVDSNNFGYKLDATADSSRKSYILQNNTGGTARTGGFLSDAPTTQYARITDYGTLPFLNNLTATDNSFQVGIANVTPTTVNYITITLYNSAGSTLGTFNVNNLQSNGGYSGNSPDLPSTTFATSRLVYFGAFPANLTGSGNATWLTHQANVAYYTIDAYDNTSCPPAECPPKKIGEQYRIDIVSGDCRFETIRLTWLNKHGTWDYYTFTKKSVKSLTTNRTNYTQLGGSWNGKSYTKRSDKGGQKNFRVNTKERIKVNTDYVTEEHAVWFEQLINSTEVYILNEYFDTPSGVALAGGNINRYVEPVVLTTSSYTRKTKGNDKLIQYNFEMERVKDRRTQNV
jgi:hypothetical protein